MEKNITKLSQVDKGILKIKYKGRPISIDLNEELRIDENLVNTSLRKSPSNYSLLLMARDKAINKMDVLEKAKDLAYSKAWVYFKESSNLSNEACAQKAEMNASYQGCLKRYLKAKFKANELISICRAYESRENILRTISANLRKQQ